MLLPCDDSSDRQPALYTPCQSSGTKTSQLFCFTPILYFMYPISSNLSFGKSFWIHSFFYICIQFELPLSSAGSVPLHLSTCNNFLAGFLFQAFYGNYPFRLHQITKPLHNIPISHQMKLSLLSLEFTAQAEGFLSLHLTANPQSGPTSSVLLQVTCHLRPRKAIYTCLEDRAKCNEWKNPHLVHFYIPLGI